VPQNTQAFGTIAFSMRLPACCSNAFARLVIDAHLTTEFSLADGLPCHTVFGLVRGESVLPYGDRFEVLIMNSRSDILPLNCKDVQRRFDRAASHFDSADFVHSVTRDGLFARLEAIVIDARTVIDLGSATGSGHRLLARRFHRAHIISVDLAHNMLVQARRKKSWYVRSSLVQANAEAMPFCDQSVDVVFANLLLPWATDPAHIFAEVARVLRKDGLFVFATLGPDSLRELRRAWRVADEGEHINRFLDMHDLGDAAIRSRLRDPVLDVDRLTVTYNSHTDLFRDLTAMGARNSLRDRYRSLVGPGRFATMTDALDAVSRDGVISLDLELVYGHCWGSGTQTGEGEYRIDAAQVGRRER
jgi:malonyl-CoA O-methyltransferase